MLPASSRRFVLALLLAGDVPKLLLADGPKPEVAPPESFSDQQREHWAYKRPRRPELPEVKEAGWARNPVDRFLLSGMEAIDFKHSPEADRVALIRRVTFDLTGLPPTPSEVADFLADGRVDAYERLVDRLLASPHFGERSAQHCWTWPTTPTPTGSSSTPNARTPGGIATGSSRPSTTTCLMTDSSPSNSPGTRPRPGTTPR